MRRSRNLPVEVRDENDEVAPIQGPLDYRPTDDMMRLRAEFFVLLEENPLDQRSIPEKIREYLPAHKAEQILRLMERNPAFVSWFAATHEFESKLKYLADKSLQALQDLLSNDHPAAANAKVKAAQIILTLSGKAAKTPKTSEDNLMKAVQNLDAAECKALLSNGTELKVSVKKHDTLEAIIEERE